MIDPRSEHSSSIFVRAKTSRCSSLTQREIARGASWFSNAQVGQPALSGQSFATRATSCRGQLLRIKEIEAVGAVEPAIAPVNACISRRAIDRRRPRRA